MNLIKQIPYIVIAFLILVIAFKECGGGKGSEVKSDTVTVTKIDTVFVEVSGTAKSNPKVITEHDTINHYITKTKDCDKPHLNDKGIDILKYRQYRDTVQIEGYFVSYDADVIGELRGIKLGLNGDIPKIRQSTVRTVNTTVEKYNSIGAYMNYNRSLQLGVEYKQRNLSYSLNYDLEYQSIGVKIGYFPINW